MVKRAGAIGGHYGVTGHKMDRNLALFASVLEQYHCGATFPITAVTLSRNMRTIQKYQGRNIEFAVHGYFHSDHTRLSREVLIKQLDLSRRLFERHRVNSSGFRSPYLRWNENTISAVLNTGFLYDGSQAIAWDVVNGFESDPYRRALDFYGALPASSVPALPSIDNGLVRIPYCLPDDEALVDRFQLKSSSSMNRPWLEILEETHRSGELFTLGLHPERIHQCQAALMETLDRARQLTPGIWIARLDEVARWWKSRTETKVSIHPLGKNEWLIHVSGPEGLTVLARDVEVISPLVEWDGRYRRAIGTEVRLRSSRRPFIGVSPSSHPELKSFLRQQGYIIEEAEVEGTQTLYLDQREFRKKDERRLMTMIEESDFPLVRLGRWPDGARSALSITGDIDAMTFWDYSFRFIGR
ncbi:MAG: polysaccharide deacetylase family protein [Candidatus Methanosuratincola sp.]